MSPWSRGTGPALCSLLALASFVGTASLVRRVVPLPDRGTISEKLDYFFEHGDRYDVVLLGTSRVASGLDPAVMEPELARRGHDLAVFNLGLPAVGAYEVDYYLRRVLDLPRGHLQLVLVEAWWGPPVALDRNAFTQRRVEWHSLRETVAAVRASLEEPEWSPEERRRQALGHLRHFAWRTANFGRGPDIASALLEPEDPSATGLAKAGGFRPWTLEPRHAPGEGGTQLSWSRPLGTVDPTERHSALELYGRHVELARAHDVRIVHIVAPGFREALPTRALRNEVEELRDYRPPRRGREASAPRLAVFNETRLRSDGTHLNEEGARRFSRLVAEDLAEILDRD